MRTGFIETHIVTVIISRILSWAEHITGIGEAMTGFKILTGSVNQ